MIYFAKQILVLLGIKVAHFWQQVLNPLGPYTLVFTVRERYTTDRKVTIQLDYKPGQLPSEQRRRNHISTGQNTFATLICTSESYLDPDTIKDS